MTYVHAVADSYTSADYFLGKLCQCNRAGPSHMHMWLPIVTPGPVNVLGTVIDDIGLAHA